MAEELGDGDGVAAVAESASRVSVPQRVRAELRGLAFSSRRHVIAPEICAKAPMWKGRDTAASFSVNVA
jgi:hypothetical protein